MPGLLTVELVPQSLWGVNLRSALPSERWDELRRAQYRLAGYVCELCGGKGAQHPVECHEVWDYDDVAHVQKLVRLIALCPMCHQVKHFGRSSKHGPNGVEALLAHIQKVNGWTLEQTREHVGRAFVEWKARNAHQWTHDITALAAL